VAPVVKGLLVVRAGHLVHGLLRDPIDHVRNAERAPTAAPLGDPHTSDISPAEAPVQQAALQRRRTLVHGVTDLFDRLPVWAGPASSLGKGSRAGDDALFLTNVVEPQQSPESERRTLVPGASRSR